MSVEVYLLSCKTFMIPSLLEKKNYAVFGNYKCEVKSGILNHFLFGGPTLKAQNCK